MKEDELKAFAVMATQVRKRFEIDEEMLLACKDLATDDQALLEIKRKVRLNRGQARRKKTVYNTSVLKGYDCR